MDIERAISDIAALVIIVGGLVSIARAPRQRPARTQQQPTPPPAAPSPDDAPAAQPSGPATVQPQRSALASSAYVGLRSGVLASIAMLVVRITAFGGAYTQWPYTSGLPSLGTLALLVVVVAAGFVPARRTGSWVSGLVSGLLAVFCFTVALIVLDAVRFGVQVIMPLANTRITNGVILLVVSFAGVYYGHRGYLQSAALVHHVPWY